jgi:hypothetical protein
MNGQTVHEVILNHPLGHRADPWLTAGCQMNVHDAPEESCSCGFYAVKSLFTLGRLLVFPAMASILSRTADPRAATFLVAGRVDLAGKVVEHDLGYRAERMRIAELLPFGGTEQTVARFARRLGVPVGEPIPDPDDVAAPRSSRELRSMEASLRSCATSRSSVTRTQPRVDGLVRRPSD